MAGASESRGVAALDKKTLHCLVILTALLPEVTQFAVVSDKTDPPGAGSNFEMRGPLPPCQKTVTNNARD
jgi:hypothetical protein